MKDSVEQKPKVVINDDQPLGTVGLRGRELFSVADPEGVVPDVVLSTGVLNPHDHVRPGVQRVGIADTDGSSVGNFNLIQGRERNWVNDVSIEEGRRGEKLAVATYLGVIAELQSLGRILESDPGGLSADSLRLWESLTRRRVAKVVEGAVDQHGNPRFVSVGYS